MNKVYLFIIFTISIQCMGQETFDAKLKSILNESVPFIYTEELQKQIESGEVLVFDTRTPREYEVSHISGAIFLSYDEFSLELVNHYDKKRPVVVYCTVGYRSEKIGEKLQELGFEDVHNLYGGIFDWKNKDNKVVNESGSETDSVHAYNRNWTKWLKKGIKVYE